MKKPKHHFFLESKPNKTGEQLIFLNFNYGYKEYDTVKPKYQYITLKISSRWSINKIYWRGGPDYRANKTYVSRFGKDLNNRLDKLEEMTMIKIPPLKN